MYQLTGVPFFCSPKKTVPKKREPSKTKQSSKLDIIKLLEENSRVRFKQFFNQRSLTSIYTIDLLSGFLSE